MKKEWNKPTISAVAVKETKDGETCPHEAEANGKCLYLPDIICCNCGYYKDCSWPWKNPGPCAS